MTHQQAFFIVSGIIFGLVALHHALRLAFHWPVRLRTQEIPMWLSVVGFLALPDCASGHSGSRCDGPSLRPT